MTFNIYYPHEEGCTFDMDYYINHHLPHIKEKLPGVVTGITASAGISGFPGQPPRYKAMGCIHFSCSIEEFLKAYMPYAKEFAEDSYKYTNIKSTTCDFSEKTL